MITETCEQQYNLILQGIALNYNYASLGRAGNGMTVSTLFMLNGYCCCLRKQYFRTTFQFSAGEASIIQWDEYVSGKTKLMSEMINDLLIKNRSKGK
ncbi:hypothetical protein DTR82_17905 [Salmonella enterica subsp. enterica serovar Javiana]|nr:hypothetical protein [Salmonella enterica subsp. enterica serovar Javiana]